MCVFSCLEYSFTKVDNQKQTSVNTVEQYLSNCDDFLLYIICVKIVIPPYSHLSLMHWDVSVTYY